MEAQANLTPRYLRARLDVLAALMGEARKDSTELVLLRNGVFPSKYPQKEMIQSRMNQGQYPTSDLSFFELCRFNTFFELHPEKICGEQIITSSREFPLSIKGDQALITKVIQANWADEKVMLDLAYPWRIVHFEKGPPLEVEYQGNKMIARIRQLEDRFELLFTGEDLEAYFYKFYDIRIANIRLRELIDQFAPYQSHSNLELEALALELELQIFSL